MPEDFSDLNKMFGRNIDLIGQEGFAALQKAFVIVFGLGGVGSHAASALARAGVGKIRLVDFDRLTLSSLNRHSHATQKDVEQRKVDVVSQQLININPAIQIEKKETFLWTL